MIYIASAVGNKFSTKRVYFGKDGCQVIYLPFKNAKNGQDRQGTFVLATWFWLLIKEFHVDNGLWVGSLQCILEEIISLDQQRLQPRNYFDKTDYEAVHS